MTEYSDIPAANALYTEREQVATAITYIDEGGLLTYFTISAPAVTDPMAQPMMGMPVGLQVTSVQPEVMQAMRSWCITRQNEIDAELAALGITESPPAKV